MKKTYVLDTNVLIQTPEALECFEDNEVVLPLAVLEELDNLKKKAEGEKGENARKAIRRLEPVPDQRKSSGRRRAAWRRALSESRETLWTSRCRRNFRKEKMGQPDSEDLSGG